MKRILAAIFTVVAVLTVATLIALDREATAPGALPTPQPVADQAVLDEAIKGYKLLLDLQIDEPSPELLIRGGLEGARRLVPERASPSPEPLPGTEDALRAALAALMTGHPGIDAHQLLFAFLEGMTSILQERHTIYLRPESWVDLKDNQRPFLGYSATNIDAGRLVWLVDAGSPAATAGLKPGDVITAVNGSSLAAGSTDAPQPAVIGRTDTLSVRS
ncbi:MAG: PDZ domain-containing protein, partial [Dehalococcoidia bacterium]